MPMGSRIDKHMVAGSQDRVPDCGDGELLAAAHTRRVNPMKC